jgi:hypothetical protein
VERSQKHLRQQAVQACWRDCWLSRGARVRSHRPDRKGFRRGLHCGYSRLGDAPKVVAELRKVFERGGVIGGISAGATVLASDTVNGSLGADRQWVVRPAFGLLRGVSFQPHARPTPRMESWMTKRTDLLRIAADNAAAWIVRGDIAEIVGDSNACAFERERNHRRRAVRDAACPRPLRFGCPSETRPVGRNQRRFPAATHGRMLDSSPPGFEPGFQP